MEEWSNEVKYRLAKRYDVPGERGHSARCRRHVVGGFWIDLARARDQTLCSTPESPPATCRIERATCPRSQSTDESRDEDRTYI
jgi:hypothetical protein